MEAAREAARADAAGERRQTVVDFPDLPTDLPDGWPYGPVERIIALRTGGAVSGRNRPRGSATVLD